VNKLTILQEKLLRLIQADKDFKVFGTNEPWNGHQYILNPPKPEEEVSDFEAFVKIKLPPDYRSFITTIADGYAGPFYGLYAMDEGSYQTGLRLGIQDSDLRQDWIDCFSEFPVSNAVSESYINDLLLSEKKNYFDRDDYPADATILIPLNDKPLKGVLYLAEYGCGGYYVLVVQGDCHGQVWYMEESKRMAPLCDPGGKPFSFFDWYEYWLDGSLKKVIGH